MRFIGERIREARQRANISVEELARRASVSPGSIGRIERGRANPSHVNLLRIGKALDLPQSALFDAPPRPGVGVVRQAARPRLVMPVEGLVYELLVPDLMHALAMVHTVVPPGFDNGERPFQHDGDELIHILSGRLEFHVGAETFDAVEGDSLCYDASQAHWFANRTKEQVEIIGVTYPPHF